MRVLSITKHLREQNWVAVFLDFLIVVVGVYMGLQMQEWSSKRAQNAEAAAYHERLANEYAALSDTLKKHSEHYETYLRNGINLTALMLTEQEIDQGRANQLMNTSLFSIPPLKDPAVLDEMISAGKMGFIADPAQRTQLLNARYSLQFLGTYYEFLNDGLDQILPIVQRCTVIDEVQPLAENANIPEDLVTFHYDFTCMQSEPLMPALMSEWLQRLHGTRNLYIEANLEFERIAKKLQDLANKSR
jgi:hypothetical protein